MMLQALIWDVDGTLVDSEELHRTAFNRAFEDFGLGWRWNRALYADLLKVTGGRERIRHFIARMRNAMPTPTPSDSFVNALHACKTWHYNALLSEGALDLRPGVRRILRQARDRGVRLAIATTTSRQNVETLLNRALASDGISWAAMITGEDVERKKPSPEVYLMALERLGLPASQCLAMEDSENGVRAASSAGIRAIATANDYTAGDDLSGAFAVLSHLGEPHSHAIVRKGGVGAPGQVDIDHLESWLEA